jgi:alkyl hydroperoxide reductase subunit F
VGGGPAGLTAAAYAIRKRLNCVLLSPDLGGKANARMHIEGVDTFNVINGSDLVRRFRNEIEYLDFARILEPATKIEKSDGIFLVSTAAGKCLEARAVILATGADAVRLDVPGADQYLLKGVAYSTVSYAPLYIDKIVALVGSGALALRGAAELAQIVKQLYLVAPTHGELDTPVGRRVTDSPHVELLENWSPVAVEGDVYARRLIVRAPDGYERSLEVDGIFVELGLKPHSELVQGLTAVDEMGRVLVNCGTETTTPGLFAAGDVTQLPAEQVLVAIGEGAKAALAAYEYLIKNV